MAKYCAHCGSLLAKNAAFCMACGKEVTAFIPPADKPLSAQQRQKRLRRRKTNIVLLIVAAVVVLGVLTVIYLPELAAAIVGLIILAPLCLIFDVGGSSTVEKRINGKTYVITGSHSDRKRAAQNSHRCNGDCEHCPPHYGNRYGRRYYGKGHSSGCERGGNGGPGKFREV